MENQKAVGTNCFNYMCISKKAESNLGLNQ